jgi:hypothetical protein
VDARRSIRFGLAVPATGAAANGVVIVRAVAGGEDGAAWKSAKSSSPPAIAWMWAFLISGTNNGE